MRKRNMIISCALALIITGALGETANATTNGWNQSNGGWCYYQNNSLKTGWIQDGGKWYYINTSSGVMQTGWLNDGGTWYYLDGSGAMLSNTTVGGYVLGSSGAWTGASGDSGYTQGKTPTQIAETLKNNYRFVKYNQGLLLNPYGDAGGYVNYQITFGDCTKNGHGVRDNEFKMWVLQNDSKTIQVFKDIINMAFPNKGEEAYSITTNFLNSGEHDKTVYLNGKTITLTRGTDNNHSVFWNVSL